MFISIFKDISLKKRTNWKKWWGWSYFLRFTFFIFYFLINEKWFIPEPILSSNPLSSNLQPPMQHLLRLLSLLFYPYLYHHPLLSQRDMIYFIWHDLYTYRGKMSKRKNHHQWKPLILFQKISSNKKLYLYNKQTNFKIYSG